MELLRIVRNVGIQNPHRALTLLNQFRPVSGAETAAALDEQMFWAASVEAWADAYGFSARLRSKVYTDVAARAYMTEHMSRINRNERAIRIRLIDLSRDCCNTKIDRAINPALLVPLIIGLFGSARSLRPLIAYLWPSAEIDEEPLFSPDLLIAGSAGLKEAIAMHPNSHVVEVEMPQDRSSASCSSEASRNPKITVGGRLLVGTVDVEGYVALFWSRPNARQSLERLLGTIRSGDRRGRLSGCVSNTPEYEALASFVRNALASTDPPETKADDTKGARVVIINGPDPEAIINVLLEDALAVVICPTERKVRLVASHFASESVIPVLATYDSTKTVAKIVGARIAMEADMKRADIADATPSIPQNWIREEARLRLCHLKGQGKFFIEPFMNLLAEGTKCLHIRPENVPSIEPRPDPQAQPLHSRAISACEPHSEACNRHQPVPSTTFVTGLYELRAREPRGAANQSCKSAEQYIDLAAPLLDWNADFMVFTDPKIVPILSDARRRRGLLNRTVIIPLLMEQNSCFRRVHQIHKLFANGRAPARFSPTKDTPLYVWNQASKWSSMTHALRIDAFKSRTFYWVDLGIYHVAVPPPSLAVLLTQLGSSTRLRCTFLRYLDSQTTRDRAGFFASLQQAVGGGLVGGPKEKVSWLATIFGQIFDDALTRYERPVLDEAVLGVIATTHPDQFLEIYSGHREMLLPRSAQSILSGAQQSLVSGRRARAFALLDELPDDASQSERTMAGVLRTNSFSAPL